MRTFLLIIISIMLSICAHAETKRALLIGVSDYPTHRAFADGSWSKIHGSNDVDLINETLKKQGFKIAALKNKNASADKIRKAFAKLVNECNKGDMVYIQFSGHGQAVEDMSGDETDGWDEAIIPYDAMMQYKLGIYEGDKHILDDELNLCLNSIRKKVGKDGFVYVVLDACHMGGASRGEEQDEDEVFVRGTDKGFSPSGKKYAPRIDNRSNIKITSSNEAAKICILEACRAYQTNAEIKQGGKYYGPLTYYINQYLSSHDLTSNAKWIERVRTMMGKDKRLIKQNMVIETSF